MTEGLAIQGTCFIQLSFRRSSSEKVLQAPLCEVVVPLQVHSSPETCVTHPYFLVVLTYTSQHRILQRAFILSLRR